MPLFEDYQLSKNQKRGPIKSDPPEGSKSRKRRIWTEIIEDDKTLFSSDTIPTQSQHKADTTVADPLPLNAQNSNPDMVNDKDKNEFLNSKETLSLDHDNTGTIPTPIQHKADTNSNLPPLADRKKGKQGKAENLNSKSKLSPNLSSANTDTIPAQKQHIADTNPALTSSDKQLESKLSNSEICTKKIDNTLQKEILCNTDTIPAQKQHIADTLDLSSLSKGAPQANKLTETSSKLDHNPEDVITDTTPTQYQHITDTIRTHNSTQYHHKADTEAPQKKFIPTHSLHNADTIETHNSTQSQHKADTQSDTKFHPKDREEVIYSLRGNNLRLLNAVYNLCISKGEYRISKITYEYLAEMAQVPIGSIRTTAKRLKQMSLIEIISKAKGRGAYIDIKIYQEVKDILTKQILLSNTDTKPAQYRHTIRHNTDTQSDTNLPSSSSLNNNKTTTTGNEITGEWAKIVIPNVLQPYSFGKNVVQQVLNGELLSPQELQDSLYAFAADITENNLIEKNKINSVLGYFMSIVRKKIAYPFPANYKSDEDKALEEISKRLEELKKKREESERIKLELEFEEWFSSLSLEEKAALVPDKTFKVGSEYHTRLLRAHFVESYQKGMSPDGPTLSQ